jgi:hypothetical protein
MALPTRAWRPRVREWRVRWVRFSAAAYGEGVERHAVGGAEICVYSAAKTVADCFRFRHRVGLDVALEALREVRRRKLCTSDELWACARVCRVTRVIMPYLEAMDG